MYRARFEVDNIRVPRALRRPCKSPPIRSIEGMLTRPPLRSLWHHEALYRARRRLHDRDDAIVRAQIAVSEIAAPTGEERARGAWVAHRFRALGLRNVEVDDAGNVIGQRPGSSDEAPVVICAHLDTVFPREMEVRVQRNGTLLMGP